LRQEVERAREQGWFVSERQLDDLVRGIAVPLLDASGQFVGAVSTNLFVAGESTQAALARLLGRLQDVAQAYRRLPVAAGAPAGGRAP
jgi:IclR family pca regulon transcriptional regulator